METVVARNRNENWDWWGDLGAKAGHLTALTS